MNNEHGMSVEARRGAAGSGLAGEAKEPDWSLIGDHIARKARLSAEDRQMVYMAFMMANALRDLQPRLSAHQRSIVQQRIDIESWRLGEVPA